MRELRKPHASSDLFSPAWRLGSLGAPQQGVGLSRMRSIAAVGAAAAMASLGLAGIASAQSQGAEVFNYGQCVRDGFPYNQEGFGPLVLVVNDGGFKFILPPGVSAFGPAAKPAGLIACSVVAGP